MTDAEVETAEIPSRRRDAVVLLLFITTATALAWLTSHEPEPPTSN